MKNSKYSFKAFKNNGKQSMVGKASHNKDEVVKKAKDLVKSYPQLKVFLYQGDTQLERVA